MEELKLNWVVKEYVGTKVFHKSAPDVPLILESDLKEGDEIICFSGIFTVKKGEDDRLYGQNKYLTAALEFAEDDRKCWVCCGLINNRAFKNAKKVIIG